MGNNWFIEITEDNHLEVVDCYLGLNKKYRYLDIDDTTIPQTIKLWKKFIGKCFIVDSKNRASVMHRKEMSAREWLNGIEEVFSLSEIKETKQREVYYGC
jgi:hypothetical protein